jgi:uncharacterized protein with WD repeat
VNKITLFLVMMLGTGMQSMRAQEPIVVTKKKKKKVTQAQRDQACENMTQVLDKQPNLMKALADAQQQCMECVKNCIESEGGWLNSASREQLEITGQKALACAQRMEQLTGELVQMTQAMHIKS